MVINNYEIFKEKLFKEREHTYYTLRLLIRKKDQNDLGIDFKSLFGNHDEYCLNYFTFKTEKEFYNSFQMAKFVSDKIPGSRIYISLDSKCEFKSLQTLNTYISDMNKDAISCAKHGGLYKDKFSILKRLNKITKTITSVEESSLGKEHSYILLDIDYNKTDNENELRNNVYSFLKFMENNNIEFIKTITPNGEHIIINRYLFNTLMYNIKNKTDIAKDFKIAINKLNLEDNDIKENAYGLIYANVKD